MVAPTVLIIGARTCDSPAAVASDRNTHVVRPLPRQRVVQRQTETPAGAAGRHRRLAYANVQQPAVAQATAAAAADAAASGNLERAA